MANSISTAEARKNFADLINSVAYGDETIVLTRRGKKLAALVSMKTLRLIEDLEEKLDIEDAWKIRDEAGENIKLADLKKELDI